MPGNGGNTIYAKIFALKEKIADLINAGMSEPESSLARPIVFGSQQGVEPGTKQDFQRLGLTHK